MQHQISKQSIAPWWESRAFRWALALCFAVYPWLVPWFTLDGPQHKLLAMTLRRVLAGDAIAGAFAAHIGPFSTNALFPALYAWTASWWTPDTYERAFVSVALVATLFAIRSFLRVWSPANQQWWILALPLVLSRPILMGFYNYSMGVPLMLLTLNALYRFADSGCPLRALRVIVLFWLSMYTHPFTVFAVGFGGVYLFWRHRHSARRGQLLALGVVLLLIAYPTFIGPTLFPPDAAARSRTRFHWVLQSVGNLFMAQGMDYHLGTFLGEGCITILWAALAVRAARGRHALRGLMLLFFVIYMLLPRTHGMADRINDRMVPFFWLSVLAAQPGVWRGLARAVPFALLVCVGQFLMTAGVMSDITVDRRKVADVMSAIPDGARLYPIDFDGKRGHGMVHAVIRAIWAEELPEGRIVFVPNGFALPTTVPTAALTRNQPSSATYFPGIDDGYPERIISGQYCEAGMIFDTFDCAPVVAAGFERLLSQAPYYDYVFVHRAPDALQRLLRDRGFVIERENDGFVLWRNPAPRAFEPAFPPGASS